MTENERMIQRIKSAAPHTEGESKRVLAYIASELTPDAIKARKEAEDGAAADPVKHLREVAVEHLRPIEKRMERRTVEADLV